MALNYIWFAFFVISFVIALYKLLILHDFEVFNKLITSTFDMSKTGFEISLGLTGVLSLWMGIMKVAERGGLVAVLSKAVSPFFSKLFPDIPKGHPAIGSMMMCFAANILGLDNAATPMGLKALKELQELNPDKDTASNAQILFLVLICSSLTLIPVNILVYRAELGAKNPSDVFIPILLATYCSTFGGLFVTSLFQRINLWNWVSLLYIGGITAIVAFLAFYFNQLPQDKLTLVSGLMSNVIIFTLIIAILSFAFFKKVNVYETFIEGAKEGFGVAVQIIPYLVAILVSIGVFRASGAMDYLIQGIASAVSFMGINTDFVPAMTTALMKPLSGSGARGMMLDTMKTYGADSFPGRLSCIMQGSTETTFYVLAVYYGSVAIRKTRHTLVCALLADLFGVIAAIAVAYQFFH